MELCLLGSQINLATRETNTRQQNFLNQLASLSTPSSAHRRPNSAQFQKTFCNSPKVRPQSADHRYKNLNINKSKQKLAPSKISSSTEIFNMFLSEPPAVIDKCSNSSDSGAGATGQCPASSNVVNNNVMDNNNHDINQSDEIVCNSDDVQNHIVSDGNNDGQPSEHNQSEIEDEAKLSGKSGDEFASATADNSKTNFLAWVEERNAKLNKGIDLPGRVSFSISADVLCVGDLSDESTEEVQQSQRLQSSRKSVHFFPTPVFVEHDSGSKNEFKLTSEPLSNTEKKTAEGKVTNYSGTENNSIQKENYELPLVRENTNTAQKDSWNNKHSNKIGKSKTNEIIQNNFIRKISKKIENNTFKKPTVKSASANRSSHTHHQSKPQSFSEKLMIKKSKSISCLCDRSNLNEFHIDKIESWMSMYENNNTEIEKNTEAMHKELDDAINEAEQFCSSDEKTTSNTTTTTSTPSLSSAGSTTYDEIADIIKEIDMDKLGIERGAGDSKNALKSAFQMDEQILKRKLWANCNDDDSDESAVTLEHRDGDKIIEIIKYLDDIDAKCNETLDETKYNTTVNFNEMAFCVESDIIEDVPKVSDLVMFPNHQLARRIVNLSLRANELSHGILLAKEHLTRVREDNQKAIRMEKQNTQHRLQAQKKHYEKIIHRHQGFIEQLLRDKSVLCEKITHQTRRMESQNQAWEHKQVAELQKVKETLLAGEKIRREKWVRDNTKRIKELTIKGLENEINKISMNHQLEISNLKQRHENELQDVELKHKRKSEEFEKSLRESYGKERECIIDRERMALRERFDKEIEMEQNSIEQMRQRLMNEHAEQMERIYIDMKEKEESFESIKEELIKEKNDVVEHMKRDFSEKLRANEMKQQADILRLQQQFESDFAIWKREHETIFKRKQIETEDMIRQQCRLERDRQIDIIVAKVDAEHTKTQQENEQRISRLTDKYENDLKELEKNEKLFRGRFNDTRLQLSECEASLQNNQAIIKRLEMELDHARTMRDELIKEKENFKEAARKELNHELKAYQKERNMEIEQIYARLQQAVEKKDKTLEYLQRENTDIKEKCYKLEAVIRQQRKDYCIK